MSCYLDSTIEILSHPPRIGSIYVQSLRRIFKGGKDAELSNIP